MTTPKTHQGSVTLQTCIIAFLLNLALLAQAQDSSYSVEYNKYIFFHWTGALTSHSVTLKVFPILSALNQTDYNTYVALYTKSDSGEVQVFNLYSVTFDPSDYPVTEVGLGPLFNNTDYYYTFVFSTDPSLDSQGFQAIYANGVPSEFKFSTLGIALTPYSFTFGAASCASTGSNSSIFTTLEDQEFDFFIHMGDLHYSDIAENNLTKYYNAYYKVFSSSTQKPFFQSTPIFYVWDDHDFGSGNAIGTSPSNPAVNSAYRNFVPHGTLKNNFPSDDSSVFPDTAPQSTSNSDYLSSYVLDNDIGVFQSFLVGRCLFIIMDLRTYKDVKPNDILGDEQITWLENQLRYAGYNDGVAQVFLVSSFPWIHVAKMTEWSPYPDVQQSIATLIEKYIYGYGKNIMMLSGDAHMIAFDDGSNNPYGNFSVVQAAAMDRRGSCKGGPYSHGFETGPNHFASLKVTDNGEDDPCIEVSLRNNDNEVIAYDTCNPEKYPSKVAYCPLTNTTTTTDDDDGGFLLTLIICIGIVLVGVISWVVYARSRKEQDIEAQTPDRANYFEMTEPHERRNSNN